AFDDKWSMAFLFEDIGILAAMSGNPEVALELVGAADAAREAIGAPRSPSLAQEIDQQLASAVAGLSEVERAAHRESGRALDLPAAVERALALCEARAVNGASG